MHGNHAAGLTLPLFFATMIVQSLFFLNQKFQACSHLLWPYSWVCVRPHQKPRGRFFSNVAHITVTADINQTSNRTQRLIKVNLSGIPMADLSSSLETSVASSSSRSSATSSSSDGRVFRFLLYIYKHKVIYHNCLIFSDKKTFQILLEEQSNLTGSSLFVIKL